MKSIYDLTIEEMEEYFLNIGSKKFHAKQLFSWLYEKRVKKYSDITDIKKDVLAKLENDYSIEELKIVDVQEDVDVCKYLFQLEDHEHIEAVLMKHNYGNSLCISSQVGCNMGCKFCESGRRKKVRNLEVHEMVLQLLMIEELIKMRISHVVVMGIGEPFDNYDNLIKFFKIINHPKGLAIGARHITVSTCGIVPKIYEFADFPYQVNLAISLHASNDELRSKLMPINKVYSLDKLMPAVKYYIEKTNRRVTFEYILLHGINDLDEHAVELAKLIKGYNAYVNLIPYNEVDESGYVSSNEKSALHFYDLLMKNGVKATLRSKHGEDIDAACGQLRVKYIK